jgi:hypothetical protein
MAEDNTMPNDTTQVVQPDANIPTISFGQKSYSGLNVIAGQIMEDANTDLRWPQAMQTYKEMSRDATISPALNLVEMAIRQVPWRVKVPAGMEETLKEEADFLRQVMNDMDHPWSEFIARAATHNRFGFAPIEKVYRYRTRASGSKFSDNKIGLKALPLIAQDSIRSWTFSADGRQITGLVQNIKKPKSEDGGWTYSFTNEKVKIPRKKYMLFRNNPIKDSPEGESPLKDCYIAWRFKRALEEIESVGISTDLRGMKVLYIPPRYLDPNASDEDKEVFAHYQRGLTLMHKNEQTALILPMVRDEKGNKLFELDLVSVSGQRGFDTNATIDRYKREVVTTLLAAHLILGQSGGGSYSLAESMTGITDMVIRTRLQEIADQLNHDLIPQLFALNGWDITNTPYFEFGEIQKESLENIGKYVQRISAVGLMPKTPEVVNFLTERLGVNAQYEPDEAPEAMAPTLTGYTSGAGEGLQKGAGNGTGDSVASADTSTSNLENP